MPYFINLLTMKKLIYPTFFSVLIGILGLILHYGGTLLLAFISLSIIYILLASFVSIIKYLFKRRFINRNNFVFSFIVILLLSLFYITLIFTLPHATPTKDTNLSTSEQLKYLVKTDQKDRGSLYFLFNPNRDKNRIEYVYKIINSKVTLNTLDKYNAAIILQHGSSEKDFKTAYELSKSAFDEGLKKAEWLSKATYDRWQVSMGKPQKYNTQTNIEF